MEILRSTKIDVATIHGYNVTILYCEKDKYLAVHDVEPLFCFTGETREVVEAKAQGALEFYDNYNWEKK